MSKEKSVTSFGRIDREKYSTLGVVVVLAHKAPSGVEVLLFDHKKSDKTEEGMLGLPSETMRWYRNENKTEAIKDTVARCFYEEMNYPIRKHQFFTNPGKVYKEMPFTIRKPDTVKTALARIVVMWTDDTSFVPEKIDTPEVKGAHFHNVDNILECKNDIYLRDNTLDIVTALSQNGYFDLSPQTRPVNSFENRGLVPVDLNPDVRLKK